MKNNVNDLIKKYEDLSETKKRIETELVELRTQYKLSKAELDESLKKLKDEYEITSLEDAEILVDKMYSEISDELSKIEAEITVFEE